MFKQKSFFKLKEHSFLSVFAALLFALASGFMFLGCGPVDDDNGGGVITTAPECYMISLPDTYDWETKNSGSNNKDEDYKTWYKQQILSLFGITLQDDDWEKIKVPAKSGTEDNIAYKLNKVLTWDTVKKALGSAAAASITADGRKLFGYATMSVEDNMVPERDKQLSLGNYEILLSWDLYDHAYVTYPSNSYRIRWTNDYYTQNSNVGGIQRNYRCNWQMGKILFTRKIDVYNDKLTLHSKYPGRTSSYNKCVAFYPAAYDGNLMNYTAGQSSTWQSLKPIARNSGKIAISEFLTDFVVDPNDSNNYTVTIEGMAADGNDSKKENIAKSELSSWEYDAAADKFTNGTDEVTFPYKITISGASDYDISSDTGKLPPAIPALTTLQQITSP